MFENFINLFCKDAPLKPSADTEEDFALSYLAAASSGSALVGTMMGGSLAGGMAGQSAYDAMTSDIETRMRLGNF